MASLFRAAVTKDDQITRLFYEVEQAFASLETRPLVRGAFEFIPKILMGDASITEIVTVYRGPTGKTLTLQSAGGVSRLRIIMNGSSAAVTLKAAAGDTVDGAASINLAAGNAALLVSDATSKWFSWV